MIAPAEPAWLTDVQRAPSAIPADATEPALLLFDGQHKPIETPEGWKARRRELLRLWKEFLGEIPVNHRAPALTVLDEDRPDGVVRSLVRYESEPGLQVEGYLLRPAKSGERRPGIVVLHSTTDATIRQPAGLDGSADLHLGLALAQRGSVTFCPRCYLWQYSRAGKIADAVTWLTERHPKVRGMAKMLFDARRAVDVLAAQPDVDADRLGAIGHSLGGKEVLYLAAFDDRIRATVSSEGGIGVSYSNWEAPWYLGDAIRRPGFPLDHGQVLSLVAPRAFLLVGGDSADGDRSWPYIRTALPLWRLTGAPSAVGLLNHRGGHAFPAGARVKAFEWLDWFLRAG